MAGKFVAGMKRLEYILESVKCCNFNKTDVFDLLRDAEENVISHHSLKWVSGQQSPPSLILPIGRVVTSAVR